MSSDLIRTRPTSTSSSLAARIKQQQLATGTFLLLDCSSSMNGRPIERLRSIARDLRSTLPNLRQIVFPRIGSTQGAEEIDCDIQDAHGMTPLDHAITLATELGAAHLIIVSDGEPDRPQAVLSAAKLARARIDVFYVGNPGGGGEAFLRGLATAYGGKADTISLQTQQLETKIRGMLEAGTA